MSPFAGSYVPVVGELIPDMVAITVSDVVSAGCSARNKPVLFREGWTPTHPSSSTSRRLSIKIKAGSSRSRPGPARVILRGRGHFGKNLWVRSFTGDTRPTKPLASDLTDLATESRPSQLKVVGAHNPTKTAQESCPRPAGSSPSCLRISRYTPRSPTLTKPRR